MKQCLMELEDRKLLGEERIVKFDYQCYMKACEKICQDIKANYNLEEIEIIGMARGGLPMTVTLSHLLGIRQISMIQAQMSNSDHCHDYGEFRYMSDNVDSRSKKCILFEDIIYKGKTTNGVIDILKARGKEILAVYSLVIDEGFKNIKIKNDDVEINYVYEINQDDWVYFLWEEDLTKI